MKVFLFLFLSSLFLISSDFVNALELKDGTLVDSTNAHLYIEENSSRINNFNSNNFPNGFNAVVTNFDENLLRIMIYNNYKFYQSSNFTEVYFNGPYFNIYYSNSNNCFYSSWNSSSCMDFSSSVINLTYMNGNDYFYLKNIIYISENLYYDDILVFEKKWNLIPKYFEVKFNVPSGSIIELRDSDNNIINPDSGSIYKLLSGNYTYSVSKSLYNTYNGSISVSDNFTLDIELNPIMDLSNFNNIFTSYKNYLIFLVPSMFNLENPFFFIVFGIAILFSLFLLVKKLLKGRF